MARAADVASIEGAVWAQPTAAIGALLARIPSPLGFGAVVDDGSRLGFLAESSAISDAPGITRLGGWRAWLRTKPREERNVHRY